MASQKRNPVDLDLQDTGAILHVPALRRRFVGEAFTFTEVFFEAASALSSVGLSAGITSAELADFGKWTLILLMWLGRLEIFAALALFFLLCERLVARSS